MNANQIGIPVTIGKGTDKEKQSIVFHTNEGMMQIVVEGDNNFRITTVLKSEVMTSITIDRELLRLCVNNLT